MMMMMLRREKLRNCFVDAVAVAAACVSVVEFVDGCAADADAVRQRSR